MQRSCWFCKCFDEITNGYDHVYICDKGTEASELILFPYNEDMNCFETC